ncbi:MAG: type II toxin-antitoxin system VapC family toxin [Gammaproteobacteria bacterium]
MEIHAAFAKRLRMEDLTEAAYDQCLDHFEKDWAATLIIQVDEPLARSAAAMAFTYGLRGYDSVHLAAADYFHWQSGEPLHFACFDHCRSVGGVCRSPTQSTTARSALWKPARKMQGWDTSRWLSLSWSFLSRLRYYGIVFFGVHRILADALDSVATVPAGIDYLALLLSMVTF